MQISEGIGQHPGSVSSRCKGPEVVSSKKVIEDGVLLHSLSSDSQCGVCVLRIHGWGGLCDLNPWSFAWTH